MFTKRLIQAPLAGYSCAPFRVLAHQWGKPDFCCTEMLSALQICTAASQPKRYRYKSPKEGLLYAQLAGDNAEIFAQAAVRVIEWGADYIDLNCGCPQPKIRKKNFGSRLLENSTHLFHLVSAIKKSVDVPVFAKIRVDSQSGDQYNKEVAHLVLTAWDEENLIGIARSITDFDYSCYLADLAVRKTYQGHGIGKYLIELTKKIIGPQTALLLLSVEKAIDFYTKIGFEHIPHKAFMIKREF